MATAVKKTEANALTTPSYLDEVEMKGEGVSTRPEDILMPMIAVLQPMSPEAARGGPNAIEGAEPGKFLVKNTPLPPLTEFVFQPCKQTQQVVEWKDRNAGGGGGQGFVASFPVISAKEVPGATWGKDATGRDAWKSKDGNLLVETRYLAGFIIPDNGAPIAAVIPFSSTGHTAYKHWNMLMLNQAYKGKRPDIWFIYYRVKTKLRTKGTQSWYVLQAENAGPVANGVASPVWAPTKEDIERGAALAKMLTEQGASRFDHANAAAPATASDDDSM